MVEQEQVEQQAQFQRVPGANQGLDPRWLEQQQMRQPPQKIEGLIDIIPAIREVARATQAHADAMDHLATAIGGFSHGFATASGFWLVVALVAGLLWYRAKGILGK